MTRLWVCQAACGAERLTPHSMRDIYITHALRAGATPLNAEELEVLCSAMASTYVRADEPAWTCSPCSDSLGALVFACAARDVVASGWR